MTLLVLWLCIGPIAFHVAPDLTYASGLQTHSNKREAFLSKYYEEAHDALATATQHKDLETIRLALEHPIQSIRMEAAQALEEVGDTCSIPSLIRAFDANQGPRGGGSEVFAFQRMVNVAVIHALQSLTGLKTSRKEYKTLERVGDPLVQDPRVPQTVQKYRAWWMRHEASQRCESDN